MKTRKHLQSLAIATGFALAWAGPASAVVYAGSWNNTSFGSFGDLTLDVVQTPTTATVTMTLGGFVFGQPGGAGPVVFGGALNGDGSLNVNVVGDPIFGDITGTISNLGVIDLEANNVPNPNIFNMTLDGTINATTASGIYLINFNDPATRTGPPVEQRDIANGTFNAVVPEPSSIVLLGIAGLAMVARRRR